MASGGSGIFVLGACVNKVALVAANLGDFDKPVDPITQTEGYEYCLFTDENFPPRFNAMTPRMQARIPKMFAWQLVPDYNVYIWLDSSYTLGREDSVKWLLSKLEGYDMAVFKHPDRETVLEEADYLKARLKQEVSGAKKDYVTKRYKNEWIDDHLLEVDPNQELLASTCFAYRNNLGVQQAFKRWWYYTSRYHIIDQLGFPEAIKNLKVNVIPKKYYECEYLRSTR